MELVVAALLSLLVIAGLYVVYAAETRIFRGQEMVSQAQFGVRYAMEVVQADLQRAGYMALAATDDDEAIQHQCTVPALAPIRAVELNHHVGLAHDGGSVENVTGDVARPPQTEPDELILVGNFLNEDVYRVHSRSGAVFTLQDTHLIEANDPFPRNQETYEQIFNDNDTTLIRVRHQEKVFLSRLSGKNYDASGSATITLAENPNCTEFSGSGDGAEVNVVHKVRYRVDTPWLTNQENIIKAKVPGIANRFDLYREYMDWTNAGAVPPIREVIAENVVDFQVWFLFDRMENPNTGPLVDQVYNFNLDEDDSGGPPCDGGVIGSDSSCQIRNIYGAVIRISVRAPHEDPNFLMPTGARRPLMWYEVDENSAGAARVRTLISQVPMPNLGYGL